MPDRPLKVSVVVPVFNAGDYLERCAPSLLEQSIGPDAYEVIYVNDGSTDDSEDRLARLTEQHPHARYLTQPNSGWPGKPRNVGVAASTAEYIQFVDQDDELAPEALERLYAIGSRNRADIVIGKVSGGMALPNPVFRRNVEQGTLAEVPAMESLTGHKMFRRAFLEEHQIRFPEGYWRMEDMLFVARAYVHDPRISVLADQVCYWWHRRDDGKNTSETPFSLAESYQRRRVIIDTVREGTEPGDRQDQLLRPLYRTLMRRVGERLVASDRHGAWVRALPQIGAVARECFPPTVRDGLPAVRRLVGLLTEGENEQALYTLSQRLVELIPVIQRRKARVDPNGIFRIRVKYSLNRPDRGAGSRPLTITDGPGGWSLDHALTDGIDEFHPFGVSDPLLGAQAELLLEDRERHSWWYPQAELTPAIAPNDDGGYQVVLSGELSIDPSTAAAGTPLPPGTYAVWFVGKILGTVRRRLLVVPRRAEGQPRWTVSGNAPVASRFDWTGADGRLQLEVRDRQEWLAENLQADGKTAFASGPVLPVRMAGRLPADPVPVTLTIADQPMVAELTIGARRNLGLLALPSDADLRPGRHPAFVAGADAPIGEVDSRAGRLIWLAPPPGPSRRHPPAARSGLRAVAARLARRHRGPR